MTCGECDEGFDCKQGQCIAATDDGWGELACAVNLKPEGLSQTWTMTIADGGSVVVGGRFKADRRAIAVDAAFLAKVDPECHVAWSRRISNHDGAGSPAIAGLAYDGASARLFARAFIGSADGSTHHMFEFASNGATKWSKPFADGLELGKVEPFSAVAWQPGHVAFVGNTVEFPDKDAGLIDVRSFDGASTTSIRYMGNESPEAYPKWSSAQRFTNGDFVVAGYTLRLRGGSEKRRVPWLARYTAAGAEIWRVEESMIQADQDVEPKHLSILADGDLVLVEATYGFGDPDPLNREWLMRRSGTDGSTKWVTRLHEDAQQPTNRGGDLHVASTGEILFCDGYINDSAPQDTHRFFYRRYDPVSGKLNLEQTFGLLPGSIAAYPAQDCYHITEDTEHNQLVMLMPKARSSKQPTEENYVVRVNL